MKYFYTIKFILTGEKGNFRYTYIFPLLGTLVGSYIIFMIYSIMNSMEYQIEGRLNAFHYKYYLETNISDYNCEGDNLIKGNTTIGYIENNSNYELVNVYGLDNYQSYINNKIYKYLTNTSSFINYDDILIGNELANKLNVSVGDSLILSYPDEINISTNYIPSEKYKIGGIFDIDILNYDSNSVIMSYDNLNFNHNSFYCYFDTIKDESIEYKENYILSNMIINALKFEKLIYYFFGILVISVSCFMLFITIVQSIKEKYNQLIILTSLGLNFKKIKKILIVHNLLMVTLLSLIGILFVNITLYLHLKYSFLDFLYSSLPFSVDYVNLLNFESFILLIVINTLSLISSYTPFMIINKK